MNQRFSIKGLLQLIVIMLTVCGYFTPLKAQEIIEYDYVNTRYEDGTNDTSGGGISKIRVRFENEKVFVNQKIISQSDWIKSPDSNEYIWITYDFDGMEDDNVWFSAFSENNSKDIGWNEYVVISEDRESVMLIMIASDKYKKDNNTQDRADIYSRSKSKSSKKPSWLE